MNFQCITFLVHACISCSDIKFHEREKIHNKMGMGWLEVINTLISEVERSLLLRKVGGSNLKSQTEKLAPVASMVSVHHLRPRAGMVDLVSV